MTRAEHCVEQMHVHVGICQRTGYANGRADVLDALRAFVDSIDARYDAVLQTAEGAKLIPGQPRLVDLAEIRALLEAPA